MLTLVAGTLSIATVATLFKSWRSQASAFLIIGLLLLVLSCICWSYAQGWEFGVLYALLAPGLLAWLFIMASQRILPAPKNTPSPKSLDLSRSTLLINGAHFISVLFVLLVTSVLISLGFSASMPFSTAGQLALSVILLPLVWGLCAYHYLASSKKRQPLITYVVLALLGLLVVRIAPI